MLIIRDYDLSIEKKTSDLNITMFENYIIILTFFYRPKYSEIIRYFSRPTIQKKDQVFESQNRKVNNLFTCTNQAEILFN